MIFKKIWGQGGPGPLGHPLDPLVYMCVGAFCHWSHHSVSCMLSQMQHKNYIQFRFAFCKMFDEIYTAWETWTELKLQWQKDRLDILWCLFQEVFHPKMQVGHIISKHIWTKTHKFEGIVKRKLSSFLCCMEKVVFFIWVCLNQWDSHNS